MKPEKTQIIFYNTIDVLFYTELLTRMKMKKAENTKDTSLRRVKGGTKVGRIRNRYIRTDINEIKENKIKMKNM